MWLFPPFLAFFATSSRRWSDWDFLASANWGDHFRTAKDWDYDGHVATRDRHFFVLEQILHRSSLRVLCDKMAHTVISTKLPPNIDPTKSRIAYGDRALPKLVSIDYFGMSLTVDFVRSGIGSDVIEIAVLDVCKC